jgi:mannose/cellobiose epimerase-like protein (N-acyl-D-glucosamine 2-epimerase family)
VSHSDDQNPPAAPDEPGGARWLRTETERLQAFAAGSRHPGGGFGWQDDEGRITSDQPVELWITCRMTHVFALAVLEGGERRAEHAKLLEHGVEALWAVRDLRAGGWPARWAPYGPLPGPKGAYEHAFVILAAASATEAGSPGAPELLDAALATFAQHFVGPDGLVVDQWDERFAVLDPYRGVNANMHAVEAFLAAAEATGDGEWIARALTIADRIVRGFAAGNGWRIPEHFDEHWRPLPDYNREHPADPFRPYGATIGHGLEWARLCLHVRAALGGSVPPWLLEGARSLFERAVTDGWAVDGETGLVYTVDWDGTPVVHERMHWVAAEAVAAAAALEQVTGEEQYARWYRSWWAWIEEHLVDREKGSWRHELDRHNQPSATVWRGRPDAYHAVQATLIPRRRLGVSVAGSLRR